MNRYKQIHIYTYTHPTVYTKRFKHPYTRGTKAI